MGSRNVSTASMDDYAIREAADASPKRFSAPMLPLGRCRELISRLRLAVNGRSVRFYRAGSLVSTTGACRSPVPGDALPGNPTPDILQLRGATHSRIERPVSRGATKGSPAGRPT